MSTVTFKDGIMACDTQMTIGETVIGERVDKIHRITDDVYIGCAGSMMVLQSFKQYLHTLCESEREQLKSLQNTRSDESVTSGGSSGVGSDVVVCPLEVLLSLTAMEKRGFYEWVVGVACDEVESIQITQDGDDTDPIVFDRPKADKGSDRLGYTIQVMVYKLSTKELYVMDGVLDLLYIDPELNPEGVAIGSGTTPAVTAMSLGMSAIEAVEYAKRSDAATGGYTIWYDFNEASVKRRILR